MVFRWSIIYDMRTLLTPKSLSKCKTWLFRHHNLSFALLPSQQAGFSSSSFRGIWLTEPSQSKQTNKQAFSSLLPLSSRICFLLLPPFYQSLVFVFPWPLLFFPIFYFVWPFLVNRFFSFLFFSFRQVLPSHYPAFCPSLYLGMFPCLNSWALYP